MSNIISFSKSALDDKTAKSSDGETIDNRLVNMWSENDKTLRQLEFRFFGGMGFLILSALVDAVSTLGLIMSGIFNLNMLTPFTSTTCKNHTCGLIP